MNLYDDLVEVFERNDIAYNGTIVQRLASTVEGMIKKGELSNPDPDFAEAVDIIVWAPADERDFD